MYAPQNAGRCGLKKPGMPLARVDQYDHMSESPVQTGMNGHALGRSIRFQNSSSLARRSSRSLPAMMPALMAPIEVPTTQSGSTPAYKYWARSPPAAKPCCETTGPDGVQPQVDHLTDGRGPL